MDGTSRAASGTVPCGRVYPTALDDWLPNPSVRTHHRQRSAAAPERLWAVASELRLDDARSLGRVVRWRIPGIHDEGEQWSLSGLCGRIWTLHRDYPRLDGPDAFRAWDEPGTVRVLLANWVERDGDGGSAIVSEARVAAVDRRAALRLRSLWLVIGMFERLIGGEALVMAAERAA